MLLIHYELLSTPSINDIFSMTSHKHDVKLKDKSILDSPANTDAKLFDENETSASLKKKKNYFSVNINVKIFVLSSYFRRRLP